VAVKAGNSAGHGLRVRRAESESDTVTVTVTVRDSDRRLAAALATEIRRSLRLVTHTMTDR
jgi:capsular polysaccharide biosynthesis protein